MEHFDFSHKYKKILFSGKYKHFFFSGNYKKSFLIRKFVVVFFFPDKCKKVLGDWGKYSNFFLKV